MPDTDNELHVYGFCENKCRREVMLKTDIETKFSEIDTSISSLNESADTLTENVSELQSQVSKDFILANQQELTFVNKVATISDARITENSLADVYFTSDSISIAEKASITVETSVGAVKLTAAVDPTGTIKASIRIRVI